MQECVCCYKSLRSAAHFHWLFPIHKEIFIHHSFITCFPIRRSGALQQTFYGSPPSCSILGFPSPCRSQVLPNIIRPMLLSSTSGSSCNAIHMTKQHPLWQSVIKHPSQMAKPHQSPVTDNVGDSYNIAPAQDNIILDPIFQAHFANLSETFHLKDVQPVQLLFGQKNI